MGKRTAEEKAAKKAAKTNESELVGIQKKLPKVTSCTSILSLVPGVEDGIAGQLKEASEADSAATVSTFLKEHEITIHDPSAPLPCMTFEGAPFPPALIKILTAQPFKSPSAVQAAAWPLAAKGCDVLAIAKTGSGKTLGFLIPALARCMELKPKGDGSPIVLVMAPTRELALQIKTEADKFGRPVGCRAVAVYGGAPKWGQTRELQAGCELVIATPGRMMDMLDLHGSSWSGAATSLKDCKVLVLDEADRMLDMGFEKDIRAIVGQLEVDHQTLFFTATWPKNVQNIAADLLRSANKVMVTVGTGGDKLTANKAVTQSVEVIHGSEKWAAFEKLLEPYKEGGADRGKRVIVFSNTKRDVNWIAQHCWELLGDCVDTISGDRSQKERESVIQRFRAGSVTMVIATDVAARGLDINGIERVINYDFPGPDDYIHRIGRTGRAGSTGIANSLFTSGDRKHARELVRILKDAGQVVPPALTQMVGGAGGSGYQRW